MKPPLRDKLQRLTGMVSSLGDPDAQSFVEVSRGLIRALTSYSNHHVVEKLVMVIEQAYLWAKMGDLSDLFKSFPTTALDPSEYPGLRKTIWKVGQYRTASRRLYRIARSIEILRTVTITTVNPALAAFPKVELCGYNPNVAATLSRVTRGRNTPGLLSEICRYLHKRQDAAQIEFSSSFRRTLRNSKLHAEVQILAYLKTSGTAATSPRIIQSNKKACYLCDQLFIANEAPVMPSSHGRLHPRWTLPLQPGLKELQVKLNKALELQCRRSIDLLQQKRSKIGYPYPSESSALSLSSAVSTVLEQAPDAATLSSTKPDTLSQVSKHTHSEGSGPSICSIQPDRNAPLQDLEELRIDTHQDINARSSQILPRTLQAGRTSALHRFGRAEMWVEYCVVSQNEKLGKSIVYSLRPLDDEEAASVRDKHAADILDVISMMPGTEVGVSVRSRCCIDLGSVIVELSLKKSSCRPK